MLLSHPPKLIKSIYPSLIWKIDTSEREIFLTFDDGPTPGVTDLILDKLKEKNAKGTFFCLGKNIIAHPELFKRIIEEGHTIGNHTCNHMNGWKNTSIDFLRDVEHFSEIYTTNLFRPPYGRLKNSQIKALNEKYKIIMWSILSMDYDPMITKQKCAELATKNWENGSIIVLHDSIKAKANVLYALDSLLEKAEDEGWKLSSIKDQLK